MNCRVVHQWLLISVSADSLAKPLRRHLAACPRCQKRHRRLLQLEARIKKEPAPGSDAGLQAFLARIPDLPAPPPPSPPLYRWTGLLLRLVGLGRWLKDDTSAKL